MVYLPVRGLTFSFAGLMALAISAALLVSQMSVYLNSVGLLR
jgi:hypothetical protein